MPQRLYSTLPIAWQLGIDTSDLLFGNTCPPYRVTDKSNTEIEYRLVQTVRDTWVMPFKRSRFPMMILLLGKCRVGSTALANVFGHCGLATYYQPLKAALRHEMVDKFARLPNLPGNDSVFCIKETFGPYTLIEATFDPLHILLLAEWPVDKICVVLLERKPTATLSSWVRNWSYKISMEAIERQFVIASLQRLQIERQCADHNVRCLLHRYETSNTELTIGSLFSEIGVASLFTRQALSGWQFTGSSNGSIDKVIFPDEPSEFEVPNLHTSRDKFDLNAEEPMSLSGAGLNLIEAYRLQELYETNLQRVSRPEENALVGT